MLGEALQIALQVIDILDELGISYHLGGSLASSLHGVPRQTRDVDLVVDLPLALVPTLVSRLEKDFYVDADRARSAVRRRSSFNIIHLASALKLDLFVRGTGGFDAIEFERQTLLSVGNPPRAIQVKSPEDMLLRKMLWYREGGETSDRQWSDILGILTTRGANLDFGHVRRWAEELQVMDLLERALEEAGQGMPSA
jgi:hypothetical protein